MTDKLLSTTEAATALGVSRQRLANWRSGGRGPQINYIKVGSLVRYREADLLAFMEDRMVSTVKEGALC